MQKIDHAPWVVPCACLAGTILFPSYSKPIWISGLVVLFSLLWRDLRKPVNYESLEFDSLGFAFRQLSITTTVKWIDVREVFYCRGWESFNGNMETTWRFHLSNGSQVVVHVEWPQRSKFAKAVVSNLLHVSAQATRRAMAQRGTGCWSVVREVVSPTAD